MTGQWLSGCVPCLFSSRCQSNLETLVPDEIWPLALSVRICAYYGVSRSISPLVLRPGMLMTPCIRRVHPVRCSLAHRPAQPIHCSLALFSMSSIGYFQWSALPSPQLSRPLSSSSGDMSGALSNLRAEHPIAQFDTMPV